MCGVYLVLTLLTIIDDLSGLDGVFFHFNFIYFGPKLTECFIQSSSVDSPNAETSV